MSKSVFLVLTSAIGLGGEIARAGDLVEVSEAEAINFLHRGKARLATEDDGAPVEPDADDDAGEPEPEPAAPTTTPPAAPAAGKDKDKSE